MGDTISLVLRYDGTIDQFKLDALNDDGSIKSPQYKNKVVFIYGATQENDASSLIQSIWVSDSENGKFFDLASKGNAGGLLYGGTIENRGKYVVGEPLTQELWVIPSEEYRTKYNLSSTITEFEVTDDDFLASDHKGEYFVVKRASNTPSLFIDGFVWDGVQYDIEDWMTANGTSWQKIDNSDAVTSVAGLVGDISTTQLVQALSSENLSEERLAKVSEVEETLESYAKMPTEQPLQDSILIYDSDNQTFKGSNVQISTTVQDLEYGQNDKIPTCGQVAEFVDEAVLKKQDTITDLADIRAGAGKGATAVQNVKVNGEEKKPVDGVVDLGTIGGGGGTVSFIDSDSLQGLPFGYIGGYYRSYEFDGTSREEVNLGYINNYYYDTIAIAYDDVLFEERISELKGDGKVLRTVVVRVDDSYNLYVKQFAVKKATFGWRIYTDKQLMPDSWVDLEDYCTKSEVNSAIAAAITETLNTPVSSAITTTLNTPV